MLGTEISETPANARPDGGPSQAKEPCRGTILLVDDEPTITRSYARILVTAGYTVEVAHDGKVAAGLAHNKSYDVIISDIAMPEMNGLNLLRAVREHDLDVPVILMTGGPNVESAVQALEYGALRYLSKPVDPQLLEEVIGRAIRLHQMARIRREALEAYRLDGRHLGDRAGLEIRFANALETLWMAYQPIVSWSGQQAFAHEALVRNEEPTLRSPGDLFDAAERLNRLRELGQVIRGHVANTMREHPTVGPVFVNVHTTDLDDETLFDPAAPLSLMAERVVLEITERAALDRIRDLTARIAALRKLGFRIAVDDLGAGYAGLTSFAQLEPDVVKVDMSLIRNVDASATKQKVVGTVISLCRDLKITLIAEGIETVRERDTLISLGGDLCQGYLFARPGRPFPPVIF